MSQNILILVSPEYIAGHPPFDEIFKSEGEYIYELSQLYSILKERAIELILVAEDYPGINQGTIRRIRMRSPLADVWRIVPRETPYSLEDNSLFDGAIIMADGRESVSKRISKILFQKGLLRKFHLVGRSEKLKMIAETIDHLISSDISVLIIGPSGSGKELVARAIHENSPRTKGRFITVNCGALAEGVLESELFGHEKGAFTGSVGKRDGLFLQANGGTIFLDEIGETKPDTQVRLLRVLENGVFYPVGGDYPVHSDVRVIAATNRDLAEAIHEGVFREDLYFRLGVIKINLPSLYERREDILPLLYHFAAVEKVKGFSDAAVDLLLRYDWPGNVRQLRNFVARIGALHPTGEISAKEVEQFIVEQGIINKHLPVTTGRTPEDAGHELIYRALLSLGSEIKGLKDLIISHLPSRDESESPVNTGGSMRVMEKELIESALKDADGNRKLAARKLGIGERTLYRKLKKYNLS